MSGPSYNTPSPVTSNAAATMTIEANSLRFYRDGSSYSHTFYMYWGTTQYTQVANGSSYNSQFTITRSNLNSNMNVYFKRSNREYYSGAISVYDIDEATTSSTLRINLDNGTAPTL